MGGVVEKGRRTNELTFLKNAYQAMMDHCLKQKPIEACGLLSGVNNIASTCWPMRNVLRSPNHFQMDDRQVDHVFKRIRDNGEQLVGIYHSHPTSIAYPSVGDVMHAHYPEAAYVIVSLLKRIPEVACYRIENSIVTSLKYRLGES